jgi:hypothetical protein
MSTKYTTRHGKAAARAQLETTRAKVLADLKRIAAEVTAYEAGDGPVHFGHAGDLGGVLEGLADLHMVGSNYKREAGK